LLIGEYVKSRFPLTSFLIVLLAHGAWSQTYDLHPENNSSSQNQKQGEPQSKTQSTPQFGWGASIEVSRQARAAQDAINRGDYASAVNFAEHAANAAPQNPDMWFLLGYAARLHSEYQRSLDAYNRGLRIQPASVHGLAGLAQTYAKMGRVNDAEQLLQRVIAANPKDANSLELAGELILNTDPNRAIDLLNRSDALQGSPHTDLLLSHAYSRLNNAQEASIYLNRAKARAPKDPEVLRAVADEYRDQGNYPQAIASLQAIPTKSTDVQADLAYTYQLAGKQREAAELYSRIAKSSKGNIGLDLSAAQALVNLGQFDQARPFLDDARQIDANNYRLHAILGQVAEGEDRPTDADAEYREALNKLPSEVPEGPLYPVELRLNIYELDVQLDKQNDAKQQLDAAWNQLQGLQVQPAAQSEFLRLRAAMEAASGNTEAANKDLQQALALAPTNINSLLNYGSLQWKMGQKDAARATFNKVLDLDGQNRTALSSLGYLARDQGDNKAAEGFFQKAIQSHPGDYGPYLALGDLYTSEHKYHRAEAEYQKAYERGRGNPLIVAGGTNAALEDHNFELAKRWIDRAHGPMADAPQVEREKERYLTLKGDYAASASLGFKVLEKLPNDHEGVVYLAYDLYNLGRYDETKTLVEKYDSRFHDDKDLALIAGYLSVRDHNLHQAVDDFTRALKSDPEMATGYVNRGFVYDDLREPASAVRDFETAIELKPDYGEAHLGLAYADLQRHHPKPALLQLDLAAKRLGKSHAWHLGRAEAFRQERDFEHALPEYRAALSEEPHDLPTQLAYADALFQTGSYTRSLEALQVAENLDPRDAEVYALRAQVHAKENDREATRRDIESAEKYGGDQVKILLATGDALLTLGERSAAMQRFSRALDVPNGDRLDVRLALAHIFAEEGHGDEARREVALGFSEARAVSGPVTSEDLLSAANVFLGLHDFDLAETYFDKAQLAGADPRSSGLGLTNTYLAEGRTQRAEKALASLGPATEFRNDYEYQMAAANVYRQRQDPVHALTSFAQASSVAGQNNALTAETAQFEAADEVGRPITDKISVVPDALFTPALEDLNVYALDARILNVTNPALLPPPRHSYESLVESHYRLNIPGLPAITGFAGESLTVGRFLFPSINIVEDRNTYDTFFNGGINPVLRFGSNSISFDGGLQYTIRRDKVSPQFMSQNLFRQFLYLSTNSFFNWVSVHGSAVREAGPFTDQNLHSRDAFANLEFTVGRPWGSTSLIAGYTARDVLYRPSIIEYFTTSSYAGLQHKFSDRITAALFAESLRSWEVYQTRYAIAEALLPGARFDMRITRHWSAQGSFILSRGQGYHTYDNTQSQFLVQYVRPMHGSMKDSDSEIPVSYPMRFSFGFEQQSFYDFPGSSHTTFLPVVHFTLF
jgi:tetratricopeptide (TPR) repeat protein